MEAWAGFVAAGKDASPVAPTAASSVDFERERLKLEREKFQAEMAAREAD